MYTNSLCYCATCTLSSVCNITQQCVVTGQQGWLPPRGSSRGPMLVRGSHCRGSHTLSFTCRCNNIISNIFCRTFYNRTV
ncbi:hypothetical protein XENTR_v10019769 [Xenopus tropicalis]|nr:hypothetical protein XENTR_v10019769 [Xenopus tropicalis]